MQGTVMVPLEERDTWVYVSWVREVPKVKLTSVFFQGIMR